jgi:hypothetical protein
MLLFKCASMRIQHITPSLSDVSPSSTFPMHLSQMLISGLASPPHLTGSDPDRQLVGPLHASVGMALVGDAEQDAGKDTQGKNAPGQDVQEKDAQRKTVQEKEIRTYQRIRLETSTSFIPGNWVRHLDYLHLGGTFNPAHYLHLAGLPNPFPLAFRRHQ